MPPDRCPTCDRVVATSEDVRDLAIGDCPTAIRICWGCDGPDCLAHAVDWRKRAIEAEATLTDFNGWLHMARKDRNRAEDAVASAYASGIEDGAKVVASWGPIVSDRADLLARIRALATKRSTDGNG